MDDINLKDIRVLGNQLGLKGNNAKTLVDLLPQLQGGSLLKGLVVGTTSKKEIIFHTSLGRFISPNPMALGRGDTITIRLAHKAEQLSGTVIKINNSSTSPNETIDLVFIKEDTTGSSAKLSPPTTSTRISVETDETLGRNPQSTTIKGSISYLNLNKLHSNSPLYKTLLANLDPHNNNFIVFKILNNRHTLNTALQIQGQVASSTNENGSQLIRTDFGMITTHNTNIPNGQNLLLEITNINHQDISFNATEAITKFIFDLNKHWQLSRTQASNNALPMIKAPTVNPPTGTIQSSTTLVQNIPSGGDIAAESINLQDISTIDLIGLQNHLISMNASDSMDLISALRINTRKLKTNLSEGFLEDEGIELDNDKNIFLPKARQSITSEGFVQEGFNKALKTLAGIEAIKKMSSNIHAISEMFSIIDEASNIDENQWHNFFLPIYYNKEILEQPVSVQRKKNGSLRFLIDVQFESFCEMQLDGLVSFDDHTKKSIKSFDLVVRSKDRIDNEIFKAINKIYNDRSKISGIYGHLQFDENRNILEAKDDS